jgi:hypothetical protein
MIDQKTHELKLKQPYFDAVLNGRKTFEVRYNDRDYQEGDIVIFREVDRDGDPTPSIVRIKAEIGYVLRDFAGLQDGYVAFSLRNADRSAKHAKGGICNEPFVIPGGDHVCAIRLNSIKPIPKEIAEAINRAFSETSKADDDHRGIGLTD